MPERNHNSPPQWRNGLEVAIRLSWTGAHECHWKPAGRTPWHATQRAVLEALTPVEEAR
jgi:hypothetical protein